MTMTGRGPLARWRRSAYLILFFIALFATVLALAAALAHALELPNKIALPRDEYFVVQQIYRGWWQLAYVLLVELGSMVALAVWSRREPRVLRPVLVAILALLGAQAVFWTWTFPANTATRDWTLIPANWETLRLEWEYSHAAGAALQMLATAALLWAALAAAPRQRP